MTRTWSPQQEAIFEWFKNGKGNLVVEALAGTGKTTTILEAAGRAPEGKVLLAAFNKKIAQELQDRLAESGNWNAQAQTLHALGFRFIRDAWRGVTVDDKRGWKLAEKCAPSMYRHDRELIQMAHKLTQLAKETLPNVAGPADLEPICVAFDLLDPRCGPEALSNWAFDCLVKSRENDGTIDFSDMIYLPRAMKLTRPLYDMVVVDECQDMNAAQIELALSACKGRICVVGDSHQAIYGFRGADSSSMGKLTKRLKAKVLGLTTTYRCPTSVVALAQHVVPNFVAAREAPSGLVDYQGDEIMFKNAQAGDFVLGRTNAALMSACLKFIRTGKPARIEGREIGKGLANLVKKLGGGTIEGLMDSLDKWATEQVSKAERAEDSKRAQHIKDQFDTLMVLAGECATIDELQRRLLAMFDNIAPGSAICCSTVHKAKGLEASRVWVLVPSFFVDGLGLKKGDVLPPSEEANVWYVAITRAKKDLILVGVVPNEVEDESAEQEA